MMWIPWWLWFLAGLWALHAMFRLWETRFVPLLPALSEARRAGKPPRVAAIVPARDEAPRIEQTVRRLLAQKQVDLRVVVVDDRSTDGTSEALAKLLEEHAEDGRLRVVRIDVLPPGWLGKCHACDVGARDTNADWVLFTDADIWLSEDAVARGVAAAEAHGAEHVSLVPGVKHATFAGRGALLGFSLTWLPFAAGVNRDRPRKFVGIGAFNLVRAHAHRAVGGYERLRMELVDDLKLGLMLRAAGFRTRGFIGGRDADADWGGSVPRLLRDLEKNYFAVLGFRVWVVALVVLAFASLWATALLGPLIGLALGGGARWAGLAAFAGLMSNAIPTAVLARRMRWPMSAALLAPLLIGILPVALVNSTVKTLRRGGVRWRETFYSTADLKAGLVTWKNATAWEAAGPKESRPMGR